MLIVNALFIKFTEPRNFFLCFTIFLHWQLEQLDLINIATKLIWLGGSRTINSWQYCMREKRRGNERKSDSQKELEVNFAELIAKSAYRMVGKFRGFKISCNDADGFIH